MSLHLHKIFHSLNKNYILTLLLRLKDAVAFSSMILAYSLRKRLKKTKISDWISCSITYGVIRYSSPKIGIMILRDLKEPYNRILVDHFTNNILEIV